MESDAAAADVCRSEESLLCVSLKLWAKRLIDYDPDLSLEFLMGRALDNAMLNVGLKNVARGKTSKTSKFVSGE